MEQPATPDNELSRVLELHSFAVLDTPQDPSFDDISELTRRIAGTEIGIISIVDRDRQWFKSCVGAPLGQQQTPRGISFCGHTILQRDPLIIPDALADPRFADNPLVVGEPHIRFYAGFPLITSNGYALGSLCAISREPRQLSSDQIDSLRLLASLTVQQLNHLRQVSLLSGSEGNSLGAERLQSSKRQGLGSLDQLIGRDQMLQMLDLILAMDVNTPFSLFRCRFRDYERVNATLGGLVAEEFLNEGARRVLASVPKGSSVARFTDAELVILLPFDVQEEDLQRVAERIIAFTTQSYRNGPQTLSMAIAIGIAIFQGNYDNVEAMLADSSMAVRMALRSSGSAFRFIDGESRITARETYRLESELRDALANRALDAYLQPIVDLRTGEPIGFEALARWERGTSVLSPGQFLPMLAESGITGELDLLVIEKALASVPLLAAPIPQKLMSVSVNLSGFLLEDPELRQKLLTLIEDNPLPTGWRIQVELLEDAFQDTSESFDRFLNELVDRSVVIAIDDFGTGYSSLARLLSLPIQMVKVDRAFVNRIDQTEESPRTLLRTMVTMLNDLGLSITAEGVESEKQRQWLLNNGVSKAQGYLFHKPLVINQAIQLLQDLDYRPKAIPVDPRRLRQVRRRLRRPSWRLPFFDRRQGQ
jgi:EAL domain-containing protein (putative c-di-GMP-specific phosphodiesterase class I)/GGDEF domain-containing protein